MQYQRANGCSSASIQNALSVLGVRVGQHKIEALIGDISDGADEHAILNALGVLGCSVDVLESRRRADAAEWLHLAYSGPLLLCVDDWAHWVSVVGGCADRLWLFDPAREPWNEAQNGAWPLLPKTILRRWRASWRSGSGVYYGIALLSCDAREAKRRARSAASD